MNCVQDMVISSESLNISCYTRLISWLKGELIMAKANFFLQF